MLCTIRKDLGNALGLRCNMISKIVKNGNGVYVCSYCRMRVDPNKSNCPFCGNYFSNYESAIISDVKEKEHRDEDTATHKALNTIINIFRKGK